MAIQYETNKMTVMMSNDSVINECVAVATSAMGSNDTSWPDLWRDVYRDMFDLSVVLARDDAASDKLVGMFGFGDLSQYPLLSTSKSSDALSAKEKRGINDSWVSTISNAITAKGIDLAKVDAASAIYVHADYTGQSIATTMMGKRASYQIARGITHAISFAYESTDIKNWSSTRTSAEALGVDGDNNQVYLFDLSELAL